jgi:hypothetical protein
MYKGHDFWKARMDYWANKAQLMALDGDATALSSIPRALSTEIRKDSFFGKSKILYIFVTVGLALAFSFGPRLVIG